MNYNPTKHHRRSIRLSGYDYSQAGLYFITICTQKRACLFGEIKDGVMELNEIGEIAHTEWNRTPEIRNNVELGDFVIMPNHIHGIIRLLGSNVSPMPPCRGESHSPNHLDVPRLPIMGVCHTPIPTTQNQPTIGSIIRGYKSSVAKQIGLLGFPGKLWHRNYYEHIIRNEKSLIKITEYIINNPLNWDDDSLR